MLNNNRRLKAIVEVENTHSPFEEFKMLNWCLLTVGVVAPTLISCWFSDYNHLLVHDSCFDFLGISSLVGNKPNSHLFWLFVRGYAQCWVLFSPQSRQDLPDAKWVSASTGDLMKGLRDGGGLQRSTRTQGHSGRSQDNGSESDLARSNTGNNVAR